MQTNYKAALLVPLIATMILTISAPTHAGWLHKATGLFDDALVSWNKTRQPLPDNNAKPNPQQAFVVEQCAFSYQGQPLLFNRPIEEWVKVLGPYDRKIPLANDIYVWDRFGMWGYARRNKGIINSIALYFNRPQQFSSDERRLENALQVGNKIGIKATKNRILSKPKQLFKGPLLLDGIWLNEQFAVNPANAALDQYYNNIDAANNSDIDDGYFNLGYDKAHYVYGHTCVNSDLILTLRLSPQEDDWSKVGSVHISTDDYDPEVEVKLEGAKKEAFTFIYNEAKGIGKALIKITTGSETDSETEANAEE